LSCEPDVGHDQEGTLQETARLEHNFNKLDTEKKKKKENPRIGWKTGRQTRKKIVPSVVASGIDAKDLGASKLTKGKRILQKCLLRSAGAEATQISCRDRGFTRAVELEGPKSARSSLVESADRDE